MALNNVSDKLERMDPFEERAGVRLEAVSAYQWTDDKDADYIFVGGELHPRQGLTLSKTVRVTAILYDSRGRVVAQESIEVTPKRFYGFRPFTIFTTCGKITVGRVRVIPK